MHERCLGRRHGPRSQWSVVWACWSQTTSSTRGHASALANALSLDMADWWEATPETYFDLVSKTRLMAVVTETSGEKLAAEIGKMKKGDAVLHAVEHAQGRRWLPQPLRCVVHA